MTLIKQINTDFFPISVNQHNQRIAEAISVQLS